MTSEPLKPNVHDLRYMMAGEEEQGPKLSKNEPAQKAVQSTTHAKAKKSLSVPVPSERIPLGNFKKMITVTLRKSAEHLLQDGDFVTIVKKGTKEIIQALHKTKDIQILKQHIEQFIRCETMLKNLNSKLVVLINSTSSKDLKKRKEINRIANVVNKELVQLKEKATFIDTIKKGFPREEDSFPASFVESKEPTEIPALVIGMMASYLSENEQDVMLDPLLDQFAKKSERVAAKNRASQEAYKTREVSKEIRQALKTQGEDFVFPENLKKKLNDVTSLDLSDLGVPLSAKALKEIIINWPHIVNLNVENNQMTQEVANVFQELKDLRHLNLSNTDMTDNMFEAIAKCVTLQSLDCMDCHRITSLKPLKSCPLLQSLNCSACPITSLEPLQSCPLLQSLNCSSCGRITSLKPLESCPLLQSLSCSNCGGITSLKPLESCSLLQSLNCKSCDQITSLEPLKSCLLLQSLNCSNCVRITSLEPLKSYPSLQSLICSSCPITSLEPLKSCPLLQELNCNYCRGITSLEPLGSCPLLQSLNCRLCPITSLDPMEFCPLLRELDCDDCTQITSLKPLESRPLLQSLSCSSCPITSLEPLKSCPLLWRLDCSRCPITSFEPLKSCPLLRSLNYCGCPITSLELRQILPLLNTPST